MQIYANHIQIPIKIASRVPPHLLERIRVPLYYLFPSALSERHTWRERGVCRHVEVCGGGVHVGHVQGYVR